MKSIIISHPFLVFVALLLGVLAGFAYYWKDKKFADVKRTWIYLMTALRGVAVFLLTLLLAGIIVKQVRYSLQKPLIVWLQDNSLSVKLAVDSTDLQQYVKERNQVFKRLQKKYDLRVFEFDRSVKEVDFVKNPDWKGRYTDISGAITEIKDRFFNQNLSAIVLATDGIYNLGYSPKDLPAIEQIPVYTVLLGDTTQHKDLRITSVLNNKISYFGNEFPVYVEINAKGLYGKKTKLTVSLEGKVVKTLDVLITSNDFYRKFTFYLKAQRPGKKIITVRVSPLPQERNVRNNIATSVINVIDTRQKILILSNFPHPDIAALRRSLEKNQTFEIHYFPVEKFKDDFSKYNLVILVQIPQLEKDQSNLLNRIKRSEVPVLFICGTKCDYLKLSALGSGVTLQPIPGQFEEAIPYLNSGFDLFVINKSFEKLIGQLPPLIVPFGEIKADQNLSVIFKQKIKGINTDLPLIAVTQQSMFNNTNVGIVLGEGIWRWRMTEYRLNQSFTEFDRFFSQLVQFLANKKQRKRFVVQVPEIITQGDDIIFTAQLFDKSYQPVTEPDIKLQIIDSSGKTFDYLMDKQQDYYILNIGPLSEGVYKYIARTKLGNETFKDQGSFVVKNVNIEALDLQAKKDLLEYISAKSGGEMLFSSDVSKIFDLIEQNQNIKPRSFDQVTMDELIANKIFFAIILILLAAEWLLRKYFGNL